jgi:hypothetical protein
VFPEDGDTYERLLARADRRMYKDKAGRKRPPRLALVEMTPRLDRASRRSSVAP